MNQELEQLKRENERLERELGQLEREGERLKCRASMVQLLETLGIDGKTDPVEGRRRLLVNALFKTRFLTQDFVKLLIEEFGWAFTWGYERATGISVFDLDSHWEDELDEYWKASFGELAFSLATRIWLICYHDHVIPEIEDLAWSVASELPPLPNLLSVPVGTLVIRSVERDWVWGHPVIEKSLITEKAQGAHSELQECVERT